MINEGYWCILKTYWGILKATELYWRLLMLTEGYWRLTMLDEATDTYWTMLMLTKSYWCLITRKPTDAYSPRFCWCDVYWKLLALWAHHRLPISCLCCFVCAMIYWNFTTLSPVNFLCNIITLWFLCNFPVCLLQILTYTGNLQQRLQPMFSMWQVT